MITPVTVEEVKDLRFDLGDSFYQEFSLPGGFKKEAFVHNWIYLLSHNIGVLWKLALDGKDVGLLGGILTADVNNGDITASEMFWYVQSEYRKTSWSLRLMSTFESWAKEVGAKRIAMVHLNNQYGEKLGKLYERKGYKPIEVHYVKEL